MICSQIRLQLRRVLRLLVVGCGDRKVRRVYEQIPFFGIVMVHFDVTNTERSGLMYGVRHLFDGVLFLLGVVCR